MSCGTDADHLTGQWGNQLKSARARTWFLCATLAFLPAVLVAGWFQFRVVGGLESQVNTREAFNLAARMDAVVAARASAIRMAAGSLEIENLTASGGLNRLLSNLKELFPDFRSLEVFNEQGQPLAMMGELSLAEVGRESGLLRSTNHHPSLTTDPMFQDAPANDSFFLTLRHKASEEVVWFSRVRFSREAITAALEAHRGDRSVGLVSIPPQRAATENPASGPHAFAHGSESRNHRTFNWRARTYQAVAPLATPGWGVTLKRTVPISLSYYLAMAIGGLLVVMCGIVCFRREASAQTMPEAVDASAVRELPAVVPVQDKQVPLWRDKPSDQAIPPRVATADAGEAALAEVDQHAEAADEFGSAVARSSWNNDDHEVPASETPAPSEFPCERPHGLEPACQAEEFAPAPDAGRLTWEPEVEELPVALNSPASETPQPVSDESMVLVSEEEESVIVGEPILQDAVPDTLEVSWTEPLSEEGPAAEETSSIRIVNPWS